MDTFDITSSGGDGKPRTMSSLEIAELTGKRHDNVMRDIRNTLIELHGEGGLLSFEDTHSNPQNGRSYPIFRLPRRECLILVAGYSIEVRARIIDRWEFLERRGGVPSAIDFSDPAVVLGVLGHLQTEIARRDDIIADQAVKVHALERIEKSTGSMCLSDAAKTLNARRDDFIRELDRRKWIFKRPGNKNWLAYDDKRRAGYLEHDDHLYLDSERRERVSTRCLVTAKGLVKIAELLNQPLN